MKAAGTIATALGLAFGGFSLGYGSATEHWRGVLDSMQVPLMQRHPTNWEIVHVDAGPGALPIMIVANFPDHRTGIAWLDPDAMGVACMNADTGPPR